jgi:hypothetical protein
MPIFHKKMIGFLLDEFKNKYRLNFLGVPTDTLARYKLIRKMS